MMKTHARAESAAAFITGATDGIGRAVALRLAQEGYRIVFHYNTDEGGANDLQRLLGRQFHAMYQADLTTVGSQQRLARQVVDDTGAPQVVIHNAAVAPTVESQHNVAEVSFDDWNMRWRRSLDVNLLAPANITHVLANRMIQDQVSGRIIFIGSRGAYIGEPQYPAYGVSKAGLHALSQSLALSLAPHGIAVTAVAPGLIDTPRTAKRASEISLQKLGPFARFGTPEEVAAAVAFLVRDEAEWVSGAIIDLNGASHFR